MNFKGGWFYGTLKLIKLHAQNTEYMIRFFMHWHVVINDSFPNIFQLLEIACTLPGTSAEAEHSFFEELFEINNGRGAYGRPWYDCHALWCENTSGIRLSSIYMGESTSCLFKSSLFWNSLEFCLGATYLAYKGSYYQQTYGTAMGPPVSVTVANLVMEDLEEIAISKFVSPKKKKME